MRGNGPQLVEYMKSGDAELAIAASIGGAWDRLDTWKLFDEPFDMVFSRSHRLASHEQISIDDLRPAPMCYGDQVAITPNIDR